MLWTLIIFLSSYGRCIVEGTACLKNCLIKEIENNLAELKYFETKENKNTGETYIRWGKATCPDPATLVYDGFAAGNSFNIGGSGSNYLCLSKDPQWKNYNNRFDKYAGKLFGVEYEIGSGGPYPKSFHNEDMPCAVCLSTRPTVLMIPGRLTCPTKWFKEFSGYLMSQAQDRGRIPSHYICVDEKLEKVPGGDANLDGAVIYSVEGVCGTLRCPPYVNGKEITCVVCSK